MDKMNKWIISKQVDFCYGHRVWRQVLDAELSCNSLCKCRHTHGHQGTVLVHLEGTELDDRGMFLDFNELNWFKNWIDNVLDHKMILDINDPALWHLFSMAKPDNLQEMPEKYWIATQEFLERQTQPIRELYEGLVLVPFVPTSENLSKWLWEIVNEKIGHLCKVSRIQFFETPKSQSNYYAA